MFKLPRKVFNLLLVIVFASLALAACGDNTATPAPATTAATAATTAAAATTVAQAATTAATAATTAATATTAAATTAAPATTAASATTAAASATTAAAGATTAAAGTATTAAAAAASAAVACDKPAAAASSGKTYKIGIAVQNTIPALQDAINGTKKGLEQCGFVEGKNVRYEIGNALGDIPALATIGRRFADEKVDLIVAVGTAALINMYTTNKDNGTPIIFNSVTDPYQALPDVVKSPTQHSFVTGIQAFPPVEDGLKLAQEVAPKAKNIGFIYNPSETNAVATLKEAQAVSGKLGLTIVPAIIQNSGEVLTAARGIVDKIDVFFVTTDVTLVNSLESLLQVAIENKKPMVGLDPTSGPRGVPVSIGLSYYDNGVSSAKIVAQVLDGKKADTIAIERQAKGAPVVNLKSAEQMGFKIPDSILNIASAKYTEVTPPKK